MPLFQPSSKPLSNTNHGPFPIFLDDHPSSNNLSFHRAGRQTNAPLTVYNHFTHAFSYMSLQLLPPSSLDTQIIDRFQSIQAHLIVDIRLRSNLPMLTETQSLLFQTLSGAPYRRHPFICDHFPRRDRESFIVTKLSRRISTIVHVV